MDIHDARRIALLPIRGSEGIAPDDAGNREKNRSGGQPGQGRADKLQKTPGIRVAMQP
jgi:hypothetical protein